MGQDKEKAYKIGKVLLHDEDLKIKAEYNGEIFIMKYPNPMEKAAIESEIARNLNGLSRESYSLSHLEMIEATTYVNRMIVPEESPAWFTSAWTCYDEMLIVTLYGEYLRFREGFRKRFIPT